MIDHQNMLAATVHASPAESSGSAPTTTRRQLFNSFTATVTVAAAARATGTPSAPPNILVFLSDDHSCPHLGCYGDKVIRTPNLDGFASEGIRFERAYTTSPQCSPSRGSIFTGMAPQRISMTRLGAPLPPEFKIFPEYLRERGYFTGVTCRWHHIDGPPESSSRRVGRILREHGMTTMPRRVDHLEWSEDRTTTPEIVDRFFDRIPPKTPFFLQISSVDPHRPYHNNRLLRQLHDPARIDVPPYLPDLPEVRADLARYYDAISRMDMEFGIVLDILDKRGFRDDTLVLFMGDNGFSFPHGKCSLYQQGLNVPLLIRWPGRIRPGTVSHSLISGVDLAPTFLEAAGIHASHEMEGRSFLNLLLGRSYAERKYVFGARGTHGDTDFIRSVTSASHSLIYNALPQLPYQPLGDYASEPIWQAMVAANEQGRLAEALSRIYFAPRRPKFELYDLKRDPGELHSLVGMPEYAAIEQEMKEALDEWMNVNYDYIQPPLTP